MQKLPTHSFPNRKYCDGPTDMISMRLSKKMISKLKEIAAQSGKTVTEVSQGALDEFIQWWMKQPK